MIEKPEDYELFHYGVRGMKWGVQKNSGGSGRVGSAVNSVRTKVRKRDESILEARRRVDAANDGSRKIREDLKRDKKEIKRSISNRSERRKAIKDSKAARDAELTANAKEWAKNFPKSLESTSSEIVLRTSATIAVTVAPGLSKAMANKKAADITSKTARLMAENYMENNPRPSLMSPNTISLKPDESRWG